MRQNMYRKIICIFFILSLFLGGIYTEISTASAWADVLAYLSENSGHALPAHHPSNIHSMEKPLPPQQFLSVRASDISKTAIASEQRNTRPATRALRNSLAYLYLILGFFCAFFSGRTFCLSEISDNIASSLIIIDYIHLQDGQKPVFCFSSNLV